MSDLNIGAAVLSGHVVAWRLQRRAGGMVVRQQYALLGGMRARRRCSSYEVFMGLSLMGVVVLAGSFSLTQHRRSSDDSSGS